MLKSYKLKNGLRVATYSIPQMKSVFISESVKGGSIFDSEQTSGTAHFMEHILAEGTPSFPNSEALHNFVESLAGSFNALTGAQMIKFYINGPGSHLEEMLKVTSEVFSQPLFNEEAIEKERGAILEEIWQRQDADWYKKSRFFSSVRYKKGHPFLLDDGGFSEVVKKVQRQDLTAYWSKFFHPQNTYLILVGGFDAKKVRPLLQKYFGRIPSGKAFSGFPELTNNDLTNRGVAIRNDDSLNTCYIDFSFPSISEDQPLVKQIPQGIAGSIMGRLRSSRLYKLLRVQRGLVYGVDMGAAYYQHFGYCYISTQTTREKVEEVVELITTELAEFLKYGPTDEELGFAKNYTVNRVLMQFDNPGNIANWIEGDLLWADKIYLPEEYAKMVEKISKKQVMDFMKTYWELDKLNLTVQGSIKNTKTNIKKFEKILEVL